MWLLDKNVPRQIIPILRSFSIALETAQQRNWGKLQNGQLRATASEAGFTCILTRDGLFRKDAGKALKEHPHMAIVLLAIQQMPGKRYGETFRTAWEKSPIVPSPGKLLIWP